MRGGARLPQGSHTRPHTHTPRPAPLPSNASRPQHPRHKGRTVRGRVCVPRTHFTWGIIGCPAPSPSREMAHAGGRRCRIAAGVRSGRLMRAHLQGFRQNEDGGRELQLLRSGLPWWPLGVPVKPSTCRGSQQHACAAWTAGSRNGAADGRLEPQKPVAPRPAASKITVLQVFSRSLSR